MISMKCTVLLTLLFVLLHVARAKENTILMFASGCERCAMTGQCNAAFRNGPGMFCGNVQKPSFLGYGNARPCCCPVNSVCSNTYDRCKCRVRKFSPTSHRHSTGVFDFIWSVVTTVLLFTCCMSCVSCCCGRSRNRQEYTRVSEAPPMAYPVNDYSGFDKQPVCPSAPQIYNNNGNSGGGYGTALGAGAAGLVTGAALGSMYGGNHTNNAYGNDTYEIQGDTGDYGDNAYDEIQGDY